jgi:hypothetical protein
MLRQAAVWLIFGVVAVLGPAAAQSPPAVDAPRRISVEARPITAFDTRDRSRQRFGQLLFRGGLVLISPDKAFGGISGIHMARDGRHFLAAIDKGNWLRGEIAYQDERPSAVVNAELAPMLGPDGKPLARRGWYDTESLAADGGTVYVGIERVNRIVRFDYGRRGLAARAAEVAAPPALRKLPNNKGVEALVAVPRGAPLAGALIAFAERSLDPAGHHTAYLVGGPLPGRFNLQRHRDFDISDAAFLPPGDVLVLERSFSWLEGVAIRIRRIPLAAIRPGALLDGPVIFSADMGHEIDNLEGIAVHRHGSETVVTLVSDDNFSAIQRTLLLQFTLVE